MHIFTYVPRFNIALNKCFGTLGAGWSSNIGYRPVNRDAFFSRIQQSIKLCMDDEFILIWSHVWNNIIITPSIPSIIPSGYNAIIFNNDATTLSLCVGRPFRNYSGNFKEGGVGVYAFLVPTPIFRNKQLSFKP